MDKKVELTLNTTSQCTQTNCIVEDELYQLSCNACKRGVHYRCTGLPAYQIQVIKDKTRNSFKCRNCVEVDEDLMEFMKSYEEEQLNKSNKVEELSTTLRHMSFKNDQDKVQNEAVKRKLELENSTITRNYFTLKKEMKAAKEMIATYMENEQRLKERITELQETVNSPIDVNTQDTNKWKSIETNMERKFEQMGQMMKESILSELKTANKQLELKIQEANKEKFTYAEAVQDGNEEKVPWEKVKAKSLEDNLRKIMREKKNEEAVEITERNYRSRNLIIHGMLSLEKDHVKEKIEDEKFVARLIQTIRVKVNIKSTARLGQQSSNKRPIKVTFNTEDDKIKVFSNLVHLKDAEEFRGISITEDYTIAEREMIRTLSLETKQKNEMEPKDSSIIWKLRGTPKNGLTIKKFHKQNLTKNQ